VKFASYLRSSAVAVKSRSNALGAGWREGSTWVVVRANALRTQLLRPSSHIAAATVLRQADSSLLLERLGDLRASVNAVRRGMTLATAALTSYRNHYLVPSLSESPGLSQFQHVHQKLTFKRNPAKTVVSIFFVLGLTTCRSPVR
jgi:streptomycin 6-kinase